MAEAVMPLDVKKYDLYGTELSSSEKIVMGTKDRGLHIHNEDAELHRLLGLAAEKMNLSQHGVKGKDDLSPGYLWCPADIRGYRGSDERLYICNLGRTYPPEHPEETSHIRREPRDMSIFWKLLRPEFVRRNLPLSPDVYPCFAMKHKTKRNTVKHKVCDKRLVNEVIQFAEWLSTGKLMN